jgi:hypothetical protein
MVRKAPQTRLGSRAHLMQSCNSGREFKTLFLVPAVMECKLAEKAEIRPFWPDENGIRHEAVGASWGMPAGKVLIGDLREAA